MPSSYIQHLFPCVRQQASADSILFLLRESAFAKHGASTLSQGLPHARTNLYRSILHPGIYSTRAVLSSMLGTYGTRIELTQHHVSWFLCCLVAATLLVKVLAACHGINEKASTTGDGIATWTTLIQPTLRLPSQASSNKDARQKGFRLPCIGARP